MVSPGMYGAWAVFGLTLLLAGCGGGGGSSEQPGTAEPKGLHITGVDGAGARVDMWVQPFQTPTTLRLSATDNDAVEGVRAYSADSELIAFPGGGGSVSYGFLFLELTGGEGPGLWCFRGCSLDLRFDASSRKLNIQFPFVYQYFRNISEAFISSGGWVSVAGSLTFDYDPEWLVLRPKRFPEMPVSGSIAIDGRLLEVARLEGSGLHEGEGGMYFVMADGSSLGLSLIADGDTLQLMYQEMTTLRTWLAEVPASSIERVDGRYRIQLEGQPLDGLSEESPDQVWLSLDVSVPEADGSIAVTGIAGTHVLYPRSYRLSTTNNVRHYEFVMVDQDGGRFSLTVDEQAGDVQGVELVELEGGSELIYACGVNPLPACTGIHLSDDGYAFSFTASALGSDVELDGDLAHAGVRIWMDMP